MTRYSFSCGAGKHQYKPTGPSQPGPVVLAAHPIFGHEIKEQQKAFFAGAKRSECGSQYTVRLTEEKKKVKQEKSRAFFI
jgi:hypothetical protein